MKLNIIGKVKDASLLEYTKEGYGVVTARVSRDGIQAYRGYEIGEQFCDIPVVNVLRPLEEVGAEASLASFAHKPVTVNHPWDDVDLTNWKEYAVGEASTDAVIVEENGVSYVEVTLWLKGQEAIASILAGDTELSIAYTLTYDYTPGTTADGIEYVAIQRDIDVNHIAIVPRGRAGNACRILVSATDSTPNRYLVGSNPTRDKELNASPKTKSADTKETDMTDKLKPVFLAKDSSIEVPEAFAPVLRAHLDGLDEAHTKALKDAKAEYTTALEAKDAELETAKGQILSPEAIHAMVTDKADVIAKATEMGLKLKDADTASTRNLRCQVIKSIADKDFADDVDDAVVNAAYDVATTMTPKGNPLMTKTLDEKSTLTGPQRAADAMNSANPDKQTKGDK